MLKTPKDYKYATPPDKPQDAYRISSNDILDFKIYSNDGFKLVDVTSVDASYNAILGRSFTYKVEYDGTAKLPILGHIHLKGLTIREAEVFLEEKYSTYYKNPFILLNVINRRVIVFPGSEGSARVLTLSNDNTTLLEALALSGGIFDDGRAYKVKLIRGDAKNPEVYLIDLSTIDGIKMGGLVLQANDIIYVESRPRYARKLLVEITPYLTLITSTILVIQLVKANTR
jgi:polysaccharide export outer membrane protein